MSYYVDMEGRTAGPFTLEQLGQLYRGGGIHDETLYAQMGAQEWVPISTIVPLLMNTAALMGIPPMASAPRKPMARARDSICLDCKTIARPETIVGGSFVMELLLWIVFLPLALCSWGLSLLIPICYSVWRMTSRRRVCPSCQGRMIGVVTPRGRELVDVYIPAGGASWVERFGRWCGRALRATGRGMHKLVVPEKPAAPKQIVDAEIVDDRSVQ